MRLRAHALAGVAAAVTVCTRHSYAGPRCCPYCGRERWKRLAKKLRAEGFERHFEQALADSGEIVGLRLDVARLGDELEGREIQVLALAKEIERWQSRIVEHKQRNRSLNNENQRLWSQNRHLEAEKHEWQLGRGEKRLLRQIREVVRERMMRCEPQDWKLQGESDSRTLRQVEALLFPQPERKP